MAEDLDDMLYALGAGSRAKGTQGRGKSGGSKRKAHESDEDDGSGGASDDGDTAGPSQRRGFRAQSNAKRPKAAAPDDDDDDDDADEGNASDLYEGDEDRERLANMTELEREMILAERAEKRDQDRQRRQLLRQQRASGSQAEVRASGRRKGVSAEKDSALRSLEAAREQRSSKARAANTKAAAAARGAARAKSGRAAQQGRTAADLSDDEDDGRRGKKGGRSSDDDDDEFQPSERSEESAEGGDDEGGADEEEGEAGVSAPPAPPPIEAAEANRRSSRSRGLDDDDDDDDGGGAGAGAGFGGGVGGELEGVEVVELGERRMRDSMEREDEAPEDASLEELRSIALTRTQLEQWFKEPWFEGEGLRGCIVRMSYGDTTVKHPITGEMVRQYLVMQILEIKPGHKAYAFGPQDTDKGPQTTRQMLVVQDGMGVTRLNPLIMVSNAPIEEFEYERYLRHCSKQQRTPISKLDIADAKKRLADAVNYRWDASKVAERLQRKRDMGLVAPVNIAAEKAELKRRMEHAMQSGKEEEADRYREQLKDLEAHAMGRTTDKRTFGMSHINKRNQQQNFDTAITGSSKGADKSGKGTDPFSRRATLSNIYWNTKGAAGNDAAAAAAAADKLAADKKAAAEAATASSKLKASQRKLDPAELIKQLDINIDVSRLQMPPAIPAVIKHVVGTFWRESIARHAASLDMSNKAVLSVADWRRRAGYEHEGY